MSLTHSDFNHYDQIYKGRLMVVGIVLGKNEELPEDCEAKMENSLIWITTELDSNFDPPPSI